MEIKDVKNLLSRIKLNYPDFKIDAYVQSEWYKELKDYDYDDVAKKLDEHFRNEKFGRQEPKVYFLTKYLVKTEDKNKKDGIEIRCHICGKPTLLNDFDKHFDRCSSVDYLNRKNKKIFGKEINVDKYMNMNDKEFDYKYDKFCEYVLMNSNNDEEINNLEHYFIGKE